MKVPVGIKGWSKYIALSITILCFSHIGSQSDTLSLVVGHEHMAVMKNVMIPSEDGTHLATDIYYPFENGMISELNVPVILQRTPYGKSAERFLPSISAFTKRGYIVAVQDLRGRYDSAGHFTKYSEQEAVDGAETVEWLSSIQGGNGNVGMWGTSYGAHTQADAAKMDPEGLAGLVLNMGGMTNAWDHAVRQGGAFELGRELTWAFRQIPAEINDPVVRAHFDKEKIDSWYHAWPFRKGLNPLSVAPNFESYILDEATHSDYDEFWKKIGINWVEYYNQTADVPMVHVGGWYDIFLRGTIQNFKALDELQSSPKWLIIGPWTHGGNHKSHAGDVDFGPTASIPDFRTEYQADWFDLFFKNIRSERLPEMPIQLFVMGTGDGSRNKDGRLMHGGYWMETDTWPLKNSIRTTYFLHPGGDLSTDPLTNQDVKDKTTFLFDPTHPVPTLGGNVSVRVKDGAYNQRERPDFIGSAEPYLPLKSRADIVVFQTDPLEEDVQIIGPVQIRLYCSSSAVDTDFTVKLIDVYPPTKDFPEGFEMNLTDGIVRMSYRNQRTSRDLIVPHQVYEIDMEPFPTANVFKRGHRIRVDISSSNFPRWDVNPNTGEPLGQHRRVRSADNTIYHSARYPSHMTLPIVPINQNDQD